jgi:GT2 family glycosyltransferase
VDLTRAESPTPDHNPVPNVGPFAAPRVGVSGKFLCAGGARFLVKGVTYGTFAPDVRGAQYPPGDQIRADFALMARHGINTVRVYTVPDRLLLDLAGEADLRVMVGVPWSQHVAFLGDRRTTRELRRAIVADVGRLADHSAILAFAIGNEIPAAVVRWHGRGNVEQFLLEMFDDCKSAAPESLLTYVNFPPTEYLDLGFLDFVAFNVYLHRERDLRAYVAQLQQLAGHRPLLLAELGADSIREGVQGQADLISMQVRTAFEEGACGAVAFAWTDEWWRGGFAVEDWAFGLVDRARRPKPALATVAAAFAHAPFADDLKSTWPRVSVVVCAYNAADTLEECLAALERLAYPDYEIILVDDGSKDATGAIASRHPRVSTLSIPNGGLSAARNVGLHHSRGDIVAYTDADVRVDPDWLTYLVQPFLRSEVVGSGGPNVVPPDDAWMAQCVARAPGGPTHVLLDNRIAEHVPGCNMAFRRDALVSIGGFNPIYRRAGDDVDLCWRLQARGWTIGFAPSALVWHRHRASVRAYWRQQIGYGEGERWLLPHHPDRFLDGHPVWRGHIYSPLPYVRSLSRAKVNTGPWGTAAFPSVYLQDAYPFAFMPHKVRWLAASLLLVMCGAIAAVFGERRGGWLFAGAGALGLATTVFKCVWWARRSDVRALPAIGRFSVPVSRLIYISTIAWLHFIQPFARAVGQFRGELAGIRPPSDEAAHGRMVRPSLRDLADIPGVVSGVEWRFWGEEWTPPEALLEAIHTRLRGSRTIQRLEVDDGWQPARDISIQVGRWSWLDLRALVEDHGSGKGLARVAVHLRLSTLGYVASGLLAIAVLVSAEVQRLLGISSLPVPGLFVTAVVIAVQLRRVSRTVVATRRFVTRAAATCKMRPVAPPAPRVPRPFPTWGQTWHRLVRRFRTLGPHE